MRPDEVMAEHVDEGTVHAWLDGALPVDEGARVEAHIASCAECAALVAEARGLIAASSRILSALDEVPGDVIPAAAPATTPLVTATVAGVTPITAVRPPVRRARLWTRSPALRAAAAVVVMAGGALVITSRTQGIRSTAPAAPAANESVAAQRDEPVAATATAPSGGAAQQAPSPPAAKESEERAASAMPSLPPGTVATRPAPRLPSPPPASEPAVPPAAPAPAPQMTARARLAAPLAAPSPSASDAALAQTRDAAAPGAISGRVTDARGVPLAGVAVEVVSVAAATAFTSAPSASNAFGAAGRAARGVRAVTDSAGRFVMEIAPGSATVRARGIGFAPTATTVVVAPAETTRAVVALTPVPTGLSEVVVTSVDATTSGAGAPAELRRDRAARGETLKRVAPDDAVPGCYRLRVGAWTPSGSTAPTLPPTLRLDRPPTATAWSLAEDGVLTVRRGEVALTLRVQGGAWDGVATAGERRAPVRLAREADGSACAASPR